MTTEVLDVVTLVLDGCDALADAVLRETGSYEAQRAVARLRVARAMLETLAVAAGQDEGDHHRAQSN